MCVFITRFVFQVQFKERVKYVFLNVQEGLRKIQQHCEVLLNVVFGI